MSPQVLHYEITPACAGNTSSAVGSIPSSRDRPRLRGEYSVAISGKIYRMGSPPLARGIPHIRPAVRFLIGITPACAGNTLMICFSFNLSRDHPRLRGEYYFGYETVGINRGSPPLARGIRHRFFCSFPRSGISPACAVNTRFCAASEDSPWDHPRLRGEYAGSKTRSGYRLGSPPLARGIRTDGRLPGRWNGITPACAGNTISSSYGIISSWDHPRLRGEYLNLT